MKLKNAINKLTKAGFSVSVERNQLTAFKTGTRYLITARIVSQGETETPSTRAIGDVPDVMRDYFPYTYHDSLTRAIKFATA